MKRRLLLFLIAILAVLPGCNNNNLSSGDRVLVSKFLYESRVAEPKRFDVVVFKFPNGPVEKNVPKNYIKRLLGLPGEILAIFFGQLYHLPAPEPGSPPYFDDMAGKDIDPENLWKRPFMHENESKKLFEEGKFKILRKPPTTMMALRRIVYDNDFPAKDLGPAWQRWQPARDSGWKSDKGTGFAHEASAKKDQVDWLRYRHILRPTPGPAALAPPPELITDFMAYNSFFANGWGDRTPSPNWAGDLMLECNVKVNKAEGEFWMELSKGINRFQARWDLTSGTCTLFKKGLDGNKVELDSKSSRLKAPGNYLVRFANFDARLTVWVDRELPFEDGREYPPPEVRGPDEKDIDEAVLQKRRGPTENDLEPASIGCKGSAVQISGVRLWRDTYYTQTANQASDLPLDAGDWADPAKWEAFKKMPVKTMYAQPGHYICLGDNSQQSSDSREWGAVPHRLMLGRALLVYFPFERAGAIR